VFKQGLIMLKSAVFCVQSAMQPH